VAQTAVEVRGIVRDETGGIIVGAAVTEYARTLRALGYEIAARSGG
jgi:hypothetical protein